MYPNDQSLRLALAPASGPHTLTITLTLLRKLSTSHHR